MSETPFHDFQRYLDLPRLAGLTLSPDGSRLVTVLSALNPERNRFRTALWELDPAGVHPARRLTRGATGESAPTFTPDGDLLFVAARPDPDRTEQPADPLGRCGGSRPAVARHSSSAPVRVDSAGRWSPGRQGRWSQAR